ncbi:MAG: hypothetical protein Q7S24_00010 [bacterium]|nr:hypothetical protein [bacterium]
MQNSILRTLHYFDMFAYPLTREELYRFLWRPPALSYGEFSDYLDQIVIPGVNESDGYYFLSSHQENISVRNLGLVQSETRLRRARTAAKLLRLIPFLKAIFVCNTVAAGTANDQSDIDFFIVSASKRVWIVRLFSNLILRFFGLRTYNTKTANRVCLSFFVDEKHLDLSSLRVADDDVHFAYWVYQMVPIYDPDKIHERFLRLNQWIKIFLPHAYDRHDYEYTKKVTKGNATQVWRWVWETAWQGWYGDKLEMQARELQKSRLKWKIVKKIESSDNGVVLSEGVIKLHENDTRTKLRAVWKKRIANFNV